MRRIVLLLLGWVIVSPAAVSQNEDAVWRALGTPGAVVILRHSYAPGTFDPPDSNINDCSTQRNLDAGGRAQARAIGAAFRSRGIVVGEVLSSPKCRTRDTGLLAFGRVENWSPLQGALSNPALARERVAQIHQRMQQHQDDKPLVLITHGSIVRALTGRSIAMGELIVMLRSADGTFNVVGALFIQ